MTRKDIGFLPSALSMASECCFTGGFLNGAGSCLNAGCAAPPRLHPPTPNVTLSFTLLIASSSSTSIKSSLNFPLVPVSSVLSRHFQFFFSFLNDEHENWVRYISGVFIHIYLDLPPSSTVFQPPSL